MKEDKKEKEDRRCFKCGDTNHFISDCPKHSFNDQKVFVRDVGSISEETSRKMKFVSWHMTTMRELNIAKDLRLPEEDNDCMKIKTCEEIFAHSQTRFFKNLKERMANHPFDDRYILVPRRMSSFKAKQPKRPPPNKPRNVGKSTRAQLPSSSSSESAPSDNGELPSTKLSPRSYHRALLISENMSNEQRETRGMFKNMARALHRMGRMLKKGCR
ncbi:copia protein [Tanacetum coccineum]